MAKIRMNIEFIANDLKNKFNGLSSDSNLKIGVVACVDCFEKQNAALSLAEIVKTEIIKNNLECEIVVLPAINERFKIFSSDNYVLGAYKNQITNLLELVLSEKSFDGLVFIPSGLETCVGCVLCSIRLNLPTLFLLQGLSLSKKGFNLNDILSCPGEIAKGKTSMFDFENKQKKFCEFSGTGNTFSSENIFGSILEIMELSTKYNFCIPSQSFEKEAQAKETAKTIAELAKRRLPLKKMINRKSMNNAIMLNFCLGGSPYIIEVLSQISKEAELDFDILKILSLGKNVPVLFDTKLDVEAFEEYGGTWGLLKAMIKNKIIDGEYKTFADTTFFDETKKISCENFLNPVKKEGLIVLRGNIAERYALIKTLNVPDSMTKILTNVQVFSTDREACNAVLNKALPDNCAIVIKESGKKTEMGVSVISQTPIALQSMNIEKNHIIITDGLVIDDTRAVCINSICPDSAGGNIRYLKDGDEIEIDFVKGKLNIEISNRELSLRKKKYIKENKILPKYLQNFK